MKNYGRVFLDNNPVFPLCFEDSGSLSRSVDPFLGLCLDCITRRKGIRLIGFLQQIRPYPYTCKRAVA